MDIIEGKDPLLIISRSVCLRLFGRISTKKNILDIPPGQCALGHNEQELLFQLGKCT